MKEEMVETTKMRTVLKTGWGLKEYMEGGFSRDDVSEILKVKLHMSSLETTSKKRTNHWSAGYATKKMKQQNRYS